MTFTTGDIIVIAVYFLITFALGLSLSRRAGSGLTEFFLSGRSAPWWLAGTGMVATTFAADTPLWVAGQVGQFGIAANWLWWCAAAGGMLTVFFFAGLWRRARVLTDLELIELRYSGPVMKFLRGFKAVYFGLLLNCIIIGWVNLAMLRIFKIILPPSIDPMTALIACAVITALYVAFSGLWGVALADTFQFIIAMIGAIVLAVLAVKMDKIAGAGGLQAVLPDFVFNFLPSFDTWLPPDPAMAAKAASAPAAKASAGAAQVYKMPALNFIAYAGVLWWASWYPGAEPGGGGYIAQRIMSARDERHGTLATLWFVVAHFCIRSWPWIIAGLAALVLFPALVGGKKEDGYVMLMRDVLPAPLGGLMFAAFMGAYMSTISTQLNWGGSYLVNDLYRRFIKPDESERHYILVSRLTIVILISVALLVTAFVLDSIHGAWAFILEFSAGMGFVLILRWYWWRLNAISELVSMVAPFVLGLLIRFVLTPLFAAHAPELLFLTKFPVSVFIIVAFTITATLIATYLSAPTDMEKLKAFYRRVLPAGPGWNFVRAECARDAGTASEGRATAKDRLGPKFLGWIAGTTLVYGLIFGLGSIILERYTLALGLLGLCSACVIVLYYVIRRTFAGAEARE